MTVDEFIQAVHYRTPHAFAQSMASLTEAQRKPLSKTAQQLLSDAREGEKRTLGPTHDGQMARLAVLAACARSAAVKTMTLIGDYEWSAFQILIDRRPDWAADWLNLQLQGDFPRFKFENVRRLIREGGCPKPNSRGYALTFASAALTLDYIGSPELFDEIWILFEHDVGAFSYFPDQKSIDLAEWQQSARAKVAYWGGYPRLIYHYVHHGRLDRARVLDETLAALWREFNASSRSGLMKLHELLAPDKDELAARQGSYRDLLQHSASTVVGFGLQMLKAIHKGGDLDSTAFVEALPSVLTQKTKSHAVTALSMLKAVVKEQPHLSSLATEMVIRGIGHEAADVQESALSLLETWTEQFGVESSDLLLTQREFVSPKLKGRFDSLLHKLSCAIETDGKQSKLPESVVRVEYALSELRQRAEALSAELRSACGVDSALFALEHDQLPPPVSIDQAPSVLTRLQPVHPINDLDELIDGVSRLAEAIETPMDIERIIDGICRLKGARPQDFEERTEALLKRIESFEAGFTMNRGYMAARGAVPSLICLILDWLYGEHLMPSGSGWVSLYYRRSVVDAISSPVQRLVNARLEAIRQRLRNGELGPLLSLPTHEHGWIDARVFVKRLQACLADGRSPSRNDVIYGLLRLAPDFRKEAMESSRALPDPYGRLVRYALGDSEDITSGDQEWADAWLAAGRTRNPRGALPELQCLKFPATKNATASAVYSLNWNVDQQALQYQMYVNQQNNGVVRIEPVVPEGMPSDQNPTIALMQQVGHYAVFGSFPGWVEVWLATLWPANSDCFLAMGIDRLIVRMDAPGSTWFQLGSAVRPLLHGERDWSPVALATLWIGLLSKDAEVRTVARDALAAAMQETRAHPDPLSVALLELADKSWFKLNRLSESLRDVARTSNWATLVTSEILNRLIASWQKIPRDAYHVLELQLDLLAELQSTLSESARAVLTGQTCGGKTAKLARQLCELRFEGPSATRRKGLLEVAEARIDRADRLAPAL